MTSKKTYYFKSTIQGFGELLANTPSEVNRSEYVSIISNKPLEDIGIEAIDKMEGVNCEFLNTLKKGDVCVVTVALPPQKITALVYQSSLQMMGRNGSLETFCRFVKGAATVLIDKNYVKFVSINGEPVTGGAV